VVVSPQLQARVRQMLRFGRMPPHMQPSPQP
jgi:hypothetical protein